MNIPSSSPLHIPRWAYGAGAVLYMGIIYSLSELSLPFHDTSYPFFWSFSSNLFHFPLYTGLGALLLLGFRAKDSGSSPVLNRRTCLWAMAILCSYGIFDEIHQSWTGRTPSVIDVFLDVAGGISAILILKLLVEGSLSRKGFLKVYACLCLVACLLACAGSLVS